MKFGHAFYESSDFRGKKDIFSWKRAERIDWIEYVLKDSEAELYIGYNNKTKNYNNSRRVAIINQDEKSNTFLVFFYINKVDLLLATDSWFSSPNLYRSQTLSKGLSYLYNIIVGIKKQYFF